MTATRFVNYYDVLQIPSTADNDAIRAAVTGQRRIWVKRQASPDPARRSEAETRVRDIDAAEKTLLNAATRSAFDSQLAAYRPATVDAATAPGGASWIEKARTYLDAGNPGAANYAAREALNQRANDDEAWFVRAHSSFMLSNWRDAEYEFAEAIRLQPNNALYHYGLGETYAGQSNWRSAMSEFEQAVKLEPMNPIYRTSIAQILLENDRAGEALKIMEKVVAENPGNQAFSYYLAIALHDNMLDSLGKSRRVVYNGVVVNSGGYIIVSQAQIDLVEKTRSRIVGLKVEDPDIREIVAGMKKQADEAAVVKWDFSGFGGWVTAFFFLGFLPFVVGVGGGSPGPVFFGLLAGSAIAWGCTASKRKPVWKHLRATAPLERQGI
jgi:tetratricopeptide (TPR) repeat protein